MGGIYTDERIPKSRVSRFWKNGVLQNTTDVSSHSVYGTSQVTTGYRSRGASGQMSQEDKEEGVLLDNPSARARFRVYHQELRRQGKSPYDNGHEFTSELRVNHFVEVDYTWDYFGDTYRYVGPIVTQAPSVYYGEAYVSPPSWNPGYYGPKAIALTEPTNPLVNLATTLGEIYRDGLPVNRAVATATRNKSLESFSNALGSTYLDGAFGAGALTRDVVAALKSVTESAKILRQYRAGSGKHHRRHFYFPPVRSTQIFYGPSRVNTISNSSVTDTLFSGGVAGGNSGSSSETVTTEQVVYFKGAYTYYLQQGDSLVDRGIRFEQQANKLLGFRITPEVIYDLTPWTWLLDWHTNIGDNLHNAGALSADGLVLVYGYLMCKTTTRHHIRVKGPFFGSRNVWDSSWTVVRKERLQAPPYGWGSNPGSYSDGQWAILGALGLTRAPRILRRILG